MTYHDSLRALLPALLLCMTIGLGGCSVWDSSDDAISEAEEEDSAETLFTNARAALIAREYSRAAELFNEVERQRPYSELAPGSQVMAAYSHYKADEYNEAILTLERFIDMYPTDSNVPYAYYLIAVSYYEQISDVGRDQGKTRKAKQALREVIRRFPESVYARDARLKLDLTSDHLAGKEMMVGRYYLNRKDYLAAANRFQNVIEEYQTTSQTPEALHRLVEVYLLLGVRPEAERYAAILGHNYPDSEWYERSYQLLRGEDTPASSKQAKDSKPAEADDPWWAVF